MPAVTPVIDYHSLSEEEYNVDDVVPWTDLPTGSVPEHDYSAPQPLASSQQPTTPSTARRKKSDDRVLPAVLDVHTEIRDQLGELNNSIQGLVSSIDPVSQTLQTSLQSVSQTMQTAFLPIQNSLQSIAEGV